MGNKMIHYDEQEISTYFEQASQFSSSQKGVTRLYCSKEHKEFLPVLKSWMEEAGLEVHLDAIGNLRGLYKGENRSKTLIIGSHQDTVIEGGKYDGILGVLLPLYVLKKLYENNVSVPCNIELVAFGDEEGVRYPETLLGSRALCGNVTNEDLTIVDKDGISLVDALKFIGADPNKLAECSYSKDEVIGFFEVHIEQGPVLEEKKLPVGIVTAITGIERHRIKLQGQANHAGTTPMHLRKDALLAAANIVCYANNLFAQTENLVGVVGELTVKPNAVNVIPDSVEMTVEIRSPTPEIRQDAAKKIYQYANDVAKKSQIQINANKNYQMDGARCDSNLQQQLAKAITSLDIPAFHLFSGAGHDGLAMQSLTPIAMLFLRCKAGLSHHPQEEIDFKDTIIAAQILEHFIKHIEI
ncbi:M20 family metallo-hydrolase [Cysteiniphilum sp. 6C5]|uniref:M20 family metallo-hydrolase n=1 Tax=unclassified Cysteiniphilum TaxID=2610889 RepID=UPI003F83AFAE